MRLFQSLILAIIQGVSEFLPISSSGHLNLAQHFMGVSPSLALNIFLNTATFCSVLFFFRHQISYFKKNLLYIVIGSIPAALVGFLFKNQIETIFSNPELLPLFFMITAVFVLLTKWSKPSDSKMDFKKALMIGSFQAIAFLPGVSRSGSTIFIAMMLGLSAKEAFKYSFALFVPASLGAIILGAKDVSNFNFSISNLVLSFVITFVVGIFALTILKKSLTSQKFWIFSLYVFLVAVVSFFII